jgi:hypothetical protein
MRSILLLERWPTHDSLKTPGIKGFIVEDVMLSLKTPCNDGSIFRVLLRLPEEHLSLVLSMKLSLLYWSVRRKTKQDSFLQVSLLML